MYDVYCCPFLETRTPYDGREFVKMLALLPLLPLKLFALVVGVVLWWAGCVRAGAGCVLAAFFVVVRVRGDPKLPAGLPVLYAPRGSYLDAAVLRWCLGAEAALHGPEEASGDGRGILRFSGSVPILQLQPVLPVTLEYRKAAHNPALTHGVHLAWHALRTLSQPFNVCTVRVLPAMTPTVGETPAAYGERIRAAMAVACDAAMVDQGRRELAFIDSKGVRASWDARKTVAPPGVVNRLGFARMQ